MLSFRGGAKRRSSGGNLRYQDNGKSLQLKQELKVVLMAKHGLSSHDIDDLWNDLNQENLTARNEGDFIGSISSTLLLSYSE